VLWRHIVICRACARACVCVWFHTHAQQVTICSHNTDVCTERTVEQICNFSQVMVMAPWWWFLRELKHVGAAFISSIVLTVQRFYIFECIRWTIKHLISLMHGVTMKKTEDSIRFAWTQPNIKTSHTKILPHTKKFRCLTLS